MTNSMWLFITSAAVLLVIVSHNGAHSADTASHKQTNLKKTQFGQQTVAKDVVLKEKKFREKEKQTKLNSYNDVWADADMMQHPIDEEPRRRNRALGEMCLYSADCVSGCCMLDRDSKIRSCQPKAIKGERCTTAQIKADLYVDSCPCESGSSNCVYPGEFCTK